MTESRFAWRSHVAHDGVTLRVIAARPRVEPGLPYPLGATWDGTGVNFALFSANAEKVELCAFDPRGRREIARICLLYTSDAADE